MENKILKAEIRGERAVRRIAASIGYVIAAVLLIMVLTQYLKFDPKTGEFDLTASKFVISHKMQGAGAFKLAYTEASAINEIEATNDNDTVEYYNLRGQRIKRPENGFYIERRNGRVVKRF